MCFMPGSPTGEEPEEALESHFILIVPDHSTAKQGMTWKEPSSEPRLEELAHNRNHAPRSPRCEMAAI